MKTAVYSPKVDGVLESFQFPMPRSSIYRSSTGGFLHRRKITSQSIFYHSTSSTGPVLSPFKRILITSRSRRRMITFELLANSSIKNIDDDDLTQDHIPPASGGLFFKNATLIGLATIASKILGLLREIVMASSFGIGPVATAFKYAAVLPGFAASLLGGVNGPIHITMATILSKLPEDRQRKLFQHTNTILFVVGITVAAIVFVFAELILHVYAPGLWIMGESQITREIAVKQLKIMMPCLILAGPVGLGFGYMSAEGNNILPAISPALSSLLIIATCLFSTSSGRSSGILISFGASLGIFLQWIVQVIVLWKRWYGVVLDPWVNMLKSRDVYEFFSLLLPATISLGLQQIASFTDLCFASLVPGAAAGLSYAYLMVMAPVGLMSSIIVLPLVPTFSKMTKTTSWQSLVEALKRVMLLSMVAILAISSVTCILAEPIIRLLFERHSFDSSASALVSSLFFFYSLGSPFFILRELLVSVFYAFGNGKGPFLVSAGALALNAILDWLFVSKFYLGAEGLALSTSFTTALSVVVLFYLLQRRLAGLLDVAELVCPILLLSFCCITSSFTTFISYKMFCRIFASNFIRFGWFKELLSISFAGALGISSFFLPIILLNILGLELARGFSNTLIVLLY
ncbi:hypothetical protein ACH5RR_011032 [Cinchona calisaya]|uniref:Lipid II flippase MurJ n=1 Tax=Cinchona calisaya TaxID=153742 RepID=A0ABD3A662_9GENT